jgi:hypothetical protein
MNPSMSVWQGPGMLCTECPLAQERLAAVFAAQQQLARTRQFDPTA